MQPEDDLELDGGDAVFQALTGATDADMPVAVETSDPPPIDPGEFIPGQTYTRHSMIALHNRGLLTDSVKRHMRHSVGPDGESVWTYDPEYTVPEPNKYRCGKGHVTREEFRYYFDDSVTGEREADTGPMCRVCVLEWAGKKFRTRRMG